ncbi:ATP-binding cassette domain-containing protein [Methanococcus sp. CF]
MLVIENLRKNLSNFELYIEKLEIKDDDYFVFLGLSGSGKTTILEMIAGFIKPDSGKIILNGVDITDKPINERKIVLCNGKYLFPHLTIQKNIEYGIKHLQKSEKKEKIDNISKLLNITHLLNRKPERLSSGEQQRVALAMALVMNPEIILLDEPLSSLDRLLHEKLMYDLKDVHKSSNVTFIHVTHDFSEAAVLSNKMAILKNGKIEQIGTLQNVLKHPKNEFVAKFVGIKNILYGKCIKKDGNYIIKLLGFEIPIDEANYGDITLGIFPKDIIFSKKSEQDPETYSGKIKSIVTSSPFHSKAVIEFNGIELISEIQNSDLLKNPLKKGDFIEFYIDSISIIG